jgi:tRNA nucleotidyltransferase (CCA-adding enzyme)
MRRSAIVEGKRVMGSRSTPAIAWHIPTFVRSVIESLYDEGHEAYVVGGAVRDLCMGRPVTDWDVTTSASAAQITSLFTDLRSFSLKHETVTLVYKGNHYEVTTFRGPQQTLEDDLQHRDFTINAMAYDMERSMVIDPWGGRIDIGKKVVRGVVSPEDRFREDPLRLIRAVRIATELGFRIEGKTLKAIALMADAITSPAPERIRDEVIRILLCEKPSQGLDLMKKTGLLASILPEIAETAARKVSPRRPVSVYRHVMAVVDRVEPEEVLRAAALFHGLGEPQSPDHACPGLRAAREIMVRLCFSKSVIRRVLNLVQGQEALAECHPSWSDGDLRRFIRRVGSEKLGTIVALRRAHLLSLPKPIQAPLRRLNEVETKIRGLIKASFVRGPQDLAIGGSKVMEVTGLSPGPEIGRVLKRLSEDLMDHPEWNTPRKLVAMVKKMHPAGLPEHAEGFSEIHGTTGRLKTRAQPKS